MEDEEGQSLKGVAEVIFAKNRHGATETIKLKFQGEFAKFSDLDDFSIDDFGLPANGAPFADNNIITRPSRMNSEEDIPF